jgi:hypothetical protein
MLGQQVNWDFQWAQVVGRAWADDAFKRRLLADPAGALKEYDLVPPDGSRVEVLENPERVPESSAEVLYLVLPVKPSDADLSEEDLTSGDGPVARCWCGWCRCAACAACAACARCSCAWCGWHHPEEAAAE